MSDRDRAIKLGPELPGMRCVELLGSGGYADVYLYEREWPRTRVAVKLLRSGVLEETQRRQFVSEAEVMAELAGHPFIVSVLQAGSVPDGRPFLMMEYYESNLAARIAESPLGVPEALRYGVQLSSAVEAAHQANVIHRDIKPSNVLINQYLQPGLADFGIAGRSIGSEDESDDGIGVSLPWSPPEVLSGASNGSVASDVYSLAATVWTLLVGRSPFEMPGGDPNKRALASRIMHSRPPATGRGDVPASLDRLLQQAMAKKPAHRPQSALQLAHNFQRVESELHLTRTEIPLLDRGGRRGAIGGSTSAAPRPAPADPDAFSRGGRSEGGSVTVSRPSFQPDGATEHKAPRRVANSQSPVRARPAAAFTQSPPAAGDSTGWAGGTASTPAPSPAIPRGGAPRPAGPRETRASQPTARRPTIASPEAKPEPTDSARPGRRLLVGSGAAAGLVLVAAVLLLAGGQGSNHTTSSHDKTAITTQSTDTTAADALPSQTAPTDPTPIKATVIGHRVVFSWPAVTGITRYSWSTANGSSHLTSATQVKLSLPATGGLCITVHSFQPGSPVSQGTHNCAR